MNDVLGIVAGTALGVGALRPLAASAYLGGLALLSRRRPAPLAARTLAAFDIVVPAHNEEAGIGATIASLLALDYPRDRFRVICVADNCTDRTAEVARQAGATVIERTDLDRRGKGYALALAFERSLSEGCADAVVVVDADTVASPNLLRAFAARLEAGEQVMQAHYGVRNAENSWRTRLLTIAFALFHGVRSLGRERLRLSCGLRGNGMAFTHDVLARVPHRAFSIVEDVEYGIALAQHGVRVAYVGDAHVLGEMPGTGSASRSQRDRWEGGRRALTKQYAATLLRSGLGARDLVRLDLAADLLVPPLAQLAMVVALGTGGAAALFALSGNVALPALALWGAALLSLVLYVGRGCVLSGLGARVIVDLFWAPVYVVWKLARLFRPRREAPGEWVRTRRVTES